MSNIGAAPSSWAIKTPVDIFADFEAALAAMYEVPQSFPDTIYVPVGMFYPAPVRFRVTGKPRKPRMRDAIERARIHQLKGGAIPLGLYEMFSADRARDIAKTECERVRRILSRPLLEIAALPKWADRPKGKA